MTDQMEAAVEQTNEAAVTETAPEGAENAQETTEATEPTSEAADVENGAEQAAEAAQEAESGAGEEIIFEPVYNGKVNPISASDTERVTTLLQKGMKFENMADDLEKLHQLTAAYGAKNTGEMLDLMIAARERATKEDYIRKYGKEAGERLFEVDKAQRVSKNGTFKDADEAADKASRQAINQRLADELVELQADHPDVASIKDVPKSVIDTALQKGIPLLDAYNRYMMREQKRGAAAAKQQAVNQKATPGSLADGGNETVDPVTEAMRRSVRGTYQ